MVEDIHGRSIEAVQSGEYIEIRATDAWEYKRVWTMKPEVARALAMQILRTNVGIQAAQAIAAEEVATRYNSIELDEGDWEMQGGDNSF